MTLDEPITDGFVELLLFGLLAAGANLLGGFVLIKSGAHRLGERFLKYLVALGAGFMLAAIFIEILPGNDQHLDREPRRARRRPKPSSGAMTLLLAGYLLDSTLRTHDRSPLSLRRRNASRIVHETLRGLHGCRWPLDSHFL